MNIELERFTNKKEVVAPIYRRQGEYERRKFTLNKDNGWYRISLGNEVKALRQATPLEIRKAVEDKEIIRGYSYGRELIPLNFETGRFKYGYAQSIPVRFMQAQPWTISKAVMWEGNPYYLEMDRSADYSVLRKVREKFESDSNILELKGVTPELRYLFILYSLQKDNLSLREELERLEISEEEKEKRLEEFELNFGQRIEQVVENAGGRFKRYYESGNNLIVIWKVGSQTVKTLIDKRFKVMDLGYCASGEDRRHSLSSAIAQAQLYQENSGSVYITRE